MSRSSDTQGQRATSHSGQHPTRQAALIAHLFAYLYETGASLAGWSQDLAQEYAARVPKDQQTLPLRPEPDEDSYEGYAHWRDRLRRQVERWAKGDVNVPVEIEDAWVAALPNPYRRHCITDLCARWGHLALEIPEDGVSSADLGELIKQAGEEQVAAAPVFADGQITRDDLPYLPEAIRGCEESAAASLAMRERLIREERRFRSEEPVTRLRPIGGNKR